MKFGMEVGHGTLTTGKILRYGYLGNGCYGDEKTFSIFKYSINWRKNVPGRSIMVGSKNLRYLLLVSMVTTKKGVTGGKSRGFLQLISVNFLICNSRTKYLFL